MMVVPLLVGAFVTTCSPDTATFFSSFAGALFSGALTVLAVFYVCVGASIDLKSTPDVV
jgi:2-keto-3-deoxygluconate permease